ncbi:MAG TPA: RDD family protein [Vicinamibacterales bacterium]|nr:RDD family protein [Vicinamibacterales bacterium]
MKCPKCSYLGFETGDRCKNCGYDFSLLATYTPAVDPDLTIRVPDEMPEGTHTSWMDRLHSGVEDLHEAHAMPEPLIAETAPVERVTAPVAVSRADSAFPLFAPGSDGDDEPLIKLPLSPRTPLSVRRTPEPARFRQAPKSAQTDGPELSLEFAEDSFIDRAPSAYESPEPPAVPIAEAESCSLGRRAVAGLTDHAILFGIDAVVVYCTLRMAALTMGEWSLLPPVPMLAFLLLLKLAYFGAFTAACGQTIGKMAARIRVVADGATLDPGRAIRRTLVGAVSLLAFGAGFIPAFLDPDRRALHDRVARTRVVELPSA